MGLPYIRNFIKLFIGLIVVTLPALIWADGYCETIQGEAVFNQIVAGCTGALFKTVPADLSLE